MRHAPCTAKVGPSLTRYIGAVPGVPAGLSTTLEESHDRFIVLAGDSKVTFYHSTVYENGAGGPAS